MKDKHRHRIHPEGKHCSDLLNQLSEFVDGTLDGALCSEIEEHLKDCHNCSIVVDSLRKTIHLYQETAKAEHVPERIRERLYKRLDLEEYLDQSENSHTDAGTNSTELDD